MEFEFEDTGTHIFHIRRRLAIPFETSPDLRDQDFPDFSLVCLVFFPCLHFEFEELLRERNEVCGEVL